MASAYVCQHSTDPRVQHAQRPRLPPVMREMPPPSDTQQIGQNYAEELKTGCEPSFVVVNILLIRPTGQQISVYKTAASDRSAKGYDGGTGWWLLALGPCQSV